MFQISKPKSKAGAFGAWKKRTVTVLDSDEEKQDSKKVIKLEDDAKKKPSVLILCSKAEKDLNIKQAHVQRVKRKPNTCSRLSAERIDKKRVAVLNTTSIPRTRGPNHCYISLPDELAEDEQLQIIDEDLDPELGDSNDAGIMGCNPPCRTLDNYTIFDVNQKQRIVSWELIGETKRDVRFVGEVEAILANHGEEDDGQELNSEDEDECEVRGFEEKGAVATRMKMIQRVRSNAIFSWQDEITQNGREIWLLTQYGCHNTLENNPLILWKEFLESIKSCSSVFSHAAVKYKYTAEDIKKCANLLNNDIEAWLEFCSESGVSVHDELLESPLLKKIRYLVGNGKATTFGNKRDSHRTVRRSIPKKLMGNPATLTPRINNITAGLYARVSVFAESLKQGDSTKERKEINGTGFPVGLESNIWEHGNSARVKWIGGELWGDEDGRSGYGQVDIDGKVIKPGDYVSINPGNHLHRAKLSLERRGKKISVEENQEEKLRFARVVYLFEDGGGKYAHMRWLAHGKDTILDEISGPRELFLLARCDDNLLETISGKIEVVQLRYGDEELDEGAEGIFFYRYWYDQDKAFFEDPLKHENFEFPSEYLASEKCDSCEEGRRIEAHKKIGLLNENSETRGVVCKGVVYMKGDFVYCIPEVAGALYTIGQIEDFGIVKSSLEAQKGSKKNERGNTESYINAVSIRVRFLRRHDELLKKDFKTQLAEDMPVVRDSRRLFFTDMRVQVPAVEIEGKCFVLHKEHIENLDTWKDQENTFWYDSGMDLETIATMEALRGIGKEDVLICEETMLEKEKRDRLLEYFGQHGKKLRAMDVFAGAGGLTIGLDKGGAIKTQWAIEFAASPALSFKHNMPDVIVYNQCANILLNRAIKQHEGEKLGDLIDFQGHITPAMPQKGEVDFIYGGPPCQGFSVMNRFKKDNDIRNTLIATLLSYVDFYRPDYFLLENVKGLLEHKFGDIKMGTVKLIFRSLTSMGYQVRMNLLQAGQYGVPQTRRRVIFWGTKLGVDIPSFPQPTHNFPKNGENITLPDGRTLVSNTKRSYAPYSPVVVGDVIVDLPGFEYVNPHRVRPATIHNQAEDAIRPWIKYNTALSRSRKEDYVGVKKQTYRYPPLTEYQRSLRRGVGEDELTSHYTRIFSIRNTERICSVSLDVRSDHRSLPEALKPWGLSHPDSKAISHGMYPGLYGRLDPDGIFQTAVTVVEPCGKTGTVLHPTQHRVVSVREHARCQGFPDSYQFLSFYNDTKELHRQIGNAVPIPLAEALGRKLRDVVVERWVKEGQFQQI